MRRYAIFTALIMFIFVPFQAMAQAPSVKIAYVDMQKAMVESDKGKQASKSLMAEAERRNKDLSQKQEELQKMKDAFDKQSGLITAEARTEKERQFQTKLRDYQKMQNDYEMEMQQKHRERAQEIVKELVENVIKGIGESERYSVILEKNAVLFAPGASDITDKVISRYNEFVKRKAAAPVKK
ncbi:MAG: OmpH family outer membrane protein [Syntrophorhabdales bacterium]|jgi:outer membrane protein